METISQSEVPTIASAPKPPGSDHLFAKGTEALAAVRATRISPFLLAGWRSGLTQLPISLANAIDGLLEVNRVDGPLPAGASATVLRATDATLGPPELPREGVGVDAALKCLARILVEYGIDLTHPFAAAHLQPPPLVVAVAADALASASNASLDTYDSGPATIALERWLIGVLVKMAELGPNADGVLTPGGSISNLMGLLLARDAAAAKCGIDARRTGVAALSRPVVLCSELAHFSVQRACAALGLGEAAVQTIPSDARRRMQVGALEQTLRELTPHRTVLGIVATAGTTDFGSIDPLVEIAALARKHEVWLHVDAAYGFGALFSERLANRLTGLELADSITVDLHKLGWQPAAASVLLVSDAAAFGSLEREVAYLNPADDRDAGYDGLLGRSLQTTRRPDAVKVIATMLALGRRGLGEMVDTCHNLARYAEWRIANEPELEVVSPAVLTTVVFRYCCASTRSSQGATAGEDEINGALRRRLIEQGVALIGRTAVRLNGPDSPEQVCLKLTLLNPSTTRRDIDVLVDTILRAGRECAREASSQKSVA